MYTKEDLKKLVQEYTFFNKMKENADKPQIKVKVDNPQREIIVNNPDYVPSKLIFAQCQIHGIREKKDVAQGLWKIIDIWWYQDKQYSDTAEKIFLELMSSIDKNDPDLEKMFTSINKMDSFKNDSPRAQTLVGLCYQYGLGVAKDEKTALQLFSDAADQKFQAAIRIQLRISEQENANLRLQLQNEKKKNENLQSRIDTLLLKNDTNTTDVLLPLLFLSKTPEDKPDPLSSQQNKKKKKKIEK